MSHRTKKSISLTRRQFLAATSSSMAVFTMPAFLHGLLRHEAAQATGSPDWMPNCRAFHVHAAGGWAGWNTFVGKTASGSPLSSSTLKFHGVPSDGTSRIVTGMGAELYDGTISGFTAGFMAATSPEARLITRFTIAACNTQDDTSDITSGIIDAMTSTKATGLVSASAGLVNSPNGNGLLSLVKNPASQFIFTRTVGNVINAAAFSAILGNSNPTLLTAIANGMKRVSAAQAEARLGGTATEQRFATMQGQNYDQLTTKITPPAGSTPFDMNPTRDADMRAIFNLTEQTETNVQNSTNTTLLQATLVHNTLNGNLGMSAIRLNGYDYHGNLDSDTFNKNVELGTLVGRMCESAYRKRKQIAIYLSSDGGLSNNPDYDWTRARGSQVLHTGDRASQSSAALITVGAPEPSRNFLGYVQANNGQVEDSTPVGSDRMVTATMLANWLKLNGEEARLDKVLADAGFSPLEVAAVKGNIVFG